MPSSSGDHQEVDQPDLNGNKDRGKFREPLHGSFIFRVNYFRGSVLDFWLLRAKQQVRQHVHVGNRSRRRRRFFSSLDAGPSVARFFNRSSFSQHTFSIGINLRC